MKQPEALRLAEMYADRLHDYRIRATEETLHDMMVFRDALEAELRRLHAEVEELRGALDEAMWHVKYKELKAVNEELLEALKQHIQLHDGDCICQNCAAIAKAGETK
jgi:ElaB/YqjD/DUF883 family membrane-anchored ribosome-binding protein